MLDKYTENKVIHWNSETSPWSKTAQPLNMDDLMREESKGDDFAN